MWQGHYELQTPGIALPRMERHMTETQEASALLGTMAVSRSSPEERMHSPMARHTHQGTHALELTKQTELSCSQELSPQS